MSFVRACKQPVSRRSSAWTEAGLRPGYRAPDIQEVGMRVAEFD